MLTRLFHAAALVAMPLAAMAAAPLTAMAQVPQYHAPVVAPNSTLSTINYDHRWELYGGVAYTHFDAGPSVLQGSNLGGGDVQGAYYFNHKWSAVANLRAYYGTSGAVPNRYNVQGPAVSQYMALAGPQYRLASNEHASLSLHALFGGAYGWFGKDLGTFNGQYVTPNQIGFFNDQIAFGSAIGGSIDLNRSNRLAFRISPDAILTDYQSGGKGDLKEQFGISVGLVYRFGGHIGHARPGAPAPAAH